MIQLQTHYHHCGKATFDRRTENSASPDYGKAIHLKMQPSIRDERVMSLVPHRKAKNGVQLELVNYSSLGASILLDLIEKTWNRKLGRGRRITFAPFASDDGILPNGEERELL